MGEVQKLDRWSPEGKIEYIASVFAEFSEHDPTIAELIKGEKQTACFLDVEYLIEDDLAIDIKAVPRGAGLHLEAFPSDRLDAPILPVEVGALFPETNTFLHVFPPIVDIFQQVFPDNWKEKLQAEAYKVAMYLASVRGYRGGEFDIFDTLFDRYTRFVANSDKYLRNLKFRLSQYKHIVAVNGEAEKELLKILDLNNRIISLGGLYKLASSKNNGTALLDIAGGDIEKFSLTALKELFTGKFNIHHIARELGLTNTVLTTSNIGGSVAEADLCRSFFDKVMERARCKMDKSPT